MFILCITHHALFSKLEIFKIKRYSLQIKHYHHTTHCPILQSDNIFSFSDTTLRLRLTDSPSDCLEAEDGSHWLMRVSLTLWRSVLVTAAISWATLWISRRGWQKKFHLLVYDTGNIFLKSSGTIASFCLQFIIWKICDVDRKYLLTQLTLQTFIFYINDMPF